MLRPPKVEILTEWKGTLDYFFHDSREYSLPDIEGIDWSSSLIHGAPLAHYLVKDIDDHAGSGYKLPDKPYVESLISNARIDMKTKDQAAMKCVVLGISNQKEVEEFIKWCHENYRADQEKFPTGMLNVIVDYIKVPRAFYENLLKLQKIERFSSTDLNLTMEMSAEELHTDDMVETVKGISFGNGITWRASICLPWTFKDHKHEALPVWSVKKIYQDDPLFQFLCQFDYFYGKEIGHNILDIQTALYAIYKIDVIFPKTVDTRALIALAGLKTPTPGTVIERLVCTGALISKVVGTDGDRLITKIIEAKGVIASHKVADLRHLHISSTIYLAVIVRNLFPDPEVCCTILELTQQEWITYIVDLVISNLAGQVFDYKIKAQAVTRQDLLLSLRYIDCTDPEQPVLEREPLESLRKFSSLISDWPTIVYGGPRFLHIVRQQFCYQYETLKSINHRNKYIQPNLHQEVDKDFLQAATFNRTIASMPTTLPPVEGKGLVCWPEFQSTLFQVNPKDISNDQLFKEAKRVDRNVQVGVLEAVRLDCSLYFDIIQALETIDLTKYEFRFWKKVAFYDKLRLCALGTMGGNVPRSPKMEEIIHTKQEFIIGEQMNAKSGDNRNARKELCKALFNRTKTSESHVPRTTVQDSFFRQVKGPNYWKNKEDKKKIQKQQAAAKKREKVSFSTHSKPEGRRDRRDLRDNLSRKNVRDLRSVITNKHVEDIDCRHGGHQSYGDESHYSYGEESHHSYGDESQYDSVLYPEYRRVVRLQTPPPPSPEKKRKKAAAATVTSGDLEYEARAKQRDYREDYPVSHHIQSTANKPRKRRELIDYDYEYQTPSYDDDDYRTPQSSQSDTNHDSWWM